MNGRRNHRKRRGQTKNAVRRRVLIYRTALLLGEIKGRHRNGGMHVHSFDKGVRCRTYGLPDGSIQIKGLYGRMWGTLPDPSSRGAAK